MTTRFNLFVQREVGRLSSVVWLPASVFVLSVIMRYRVRDVSRAICRVPDALLGLRRYKVGRRENSGDRRLRNARLRCDIVRRNRLATTLSALRVVHDRDSTT